MMAVAMLPGDESTRISTPSKKFPDQSPRALTADQLTFFPLTSINTTLSLMYCCYRLPTKIMRDGIRNEHDASASPEETSGNKTACFWRVGRRDEVQSEW